MQKSFCKTNLYIHYTRLLRLTKDFLYFRHSHWTTKDGSLIKSFKQVYEEERSFFHFILKVPIGTVKSRLARARFQMSQKLRKVRNRPFCLYCGA